MHPHVFSAFEGILRQRVGESFSGTVLEVGAVPSRNSLLMSPTLASAASRVGISLDAPGEFGGFTVLGGNANDLSRFSDGSFDLILSNATLEHDPYFWLSVSEMRRVLRPGGVIVIGVPGYTPDRPFWQRWRRVLIRRVGIATRRLDWLVSGTLTYHVHNAPGDYYRFSPQALTNVFFDGMDDIRVISVLQPPRLIGSAIKCP
jgi:SAM-dependent methyltransferase